MSKRQRWMFMSGLAAVLIALLVSGSVEAQEPDLLSSDQARQAARERMQIQIDSGQAPGWVGAVLGEPIPLYDLSGAVSAYLFPVAQRGEPAGYLTVAAVGVPNPVLEFATDGHFPLSTKTSDIQEQIRSQEYELLDTRPLYLGLLSYAYELTSTQKSRHIIDLATNHIIEIEPSQSTDSLTSLLSSSSVTITDILAPQAYKLIGGVPDWNQFWGGYGCWSGCSPTSGVNVMGYWDGRGYGNLIGGGNWQGAVNEMRTHMKTFCNDSGGGATDVGDISPGVVSYARARGYRFESLIWCSDCATKPTYANYQAQMNVNHPMVVDVIDHWKYTHHTVTGVGYDTNGNYMIVHDNWPNTGENVYLQYGAGYSRIFMHPVTPKMIGSVKRWVSSYGYGAEAGGWRVESHPRMMADVNGDGKDDVVGFANAGVYVSLSTGSSFTSPQRWVSSYGYGAEAGGWRIEFHPRMMADVDGDGKDDVVGFANAGVYVSLSTGSSFSSPKRWVSSYGYDAEAGGWRVESHPRMMADVNGDGKDDVVGFANAGVHVSLSTGSSFTSPQRWVSSYGYEAGGWRVGMHPRMMADVDGDGKDDVVGFANAGVYVSLSTGSSFSSPQRWVSSYGYDAEAGGWRIEFHPRMMADVNGDGKDDVVGFANAGVYVSLSTGSSFTSPQRWVSSYGYVAGGWRVDLHPRMMADVDGDGKDDVIGFGGLGVYVSRSTGSNFGSPKLGVSSYGYYAGGWRVDMHPRMMADVNGDGLADVVGFANAGVYVSCSDGTNEFGQTGKFRVYLPMVVKR